MLRAYAVAAACPERSRRAARHVRLRPVPFASPTPCPGVAEPQRRQHVDGRAFRPAVGDLDANQDVVGGCLGVLDGDVKVAVVVEDARVGQLELRIAAAAPAVLIAEPLVGKGCLRILVQRLHVRVGWRRVEVVVALLHVLAVVAFLPGDTEQPLLENGVALVPEREREAQTALPVADAEESILAPSVGAASRVVVREVLPDCAVSGVVLTDGAPLPFGEVRTPPLPVHLPGGGQGELLGFRVLRMWTSRHSSCPACSRTGKLLAILRLARRASED